MELALIVISPSAVLDILTSSPPIELRALPSTRGVYALFDHLGEPRYIGVTGRGDKGFRDRIHNRHVTGSEGRSHKFSQAYNVGRMWRCRSAHPIQAVADATISKRLRTEFIRRFCRATVYEINWGGLEAKSYFSALTDLESQIQTVAPVMMRDWEGISFAPSIEPASYVDQLLKDLRWTEEQLSALHRQAALSVST